MIRAVARRAATGLALALSPVLFLLSLHFDTAAPEVEIVGIGVASLLLIAGLCGLEPARISRRDGVLGKGRARR